MCDSLKSPYETKFKIITSKCIRCKCTLYNSTLSIMCVQLKLLTSGFYRVVEIVSKDMILLLEM